MKPRVILAVLAHSIVMILAYSSPFWLDWRFILLALFLYYLQIWIFGGCVLTYAQYGRFDETFTGNIIIKIASLIGMKLNKESIKKFLDILPILYIIIALLYQVVLGKTVLVSIH